MNPNSDRSEPKSDMPPEFSGKDLSNELWSDAPKEAGIDKYSDTLLQPIPIELAPVAGWKEVPLTEKGEKLEPLGPFSRNNDIFTSSIYYGEHGNSPYIRPENELDGSLVTMFVREDVASMLRHAQQLLPEGHHLIVLDSYRPLKVQQALYDHYLGGLKSQHPDWDDEALSAETQKYVSLPSTVESRPSPHNTGGATDVAIYRLAPEIESQVRALDDRLDELSPDIPQNPTPTEEANNPALREAYLVEMKKIALIRQQAEFLNFGTEFDKAGMTGWLNYYEWADSGRPLKVSERDALAEGTLSQTDADFIQHGFGRELTTDEIEARDSRRLLYNVMVQAGMQPYEDEWWHYNSPKSQMGAKVAGLDHAEYGGLQLTEDNIEHETMRAMHREGLVRIQEGLMMGYHLAGKMDPSAELIALNEKALNETGDPRLTSLPRAAIIAPPDEAAA